jgi:hypothetical protein
MNIDNVSITEFGSYQVKRIINIKGKPTIHRCSYDKKKELPVDVVDYLRLEVEPVTINETTEEL